MALLGRLLTGGGLMYTGRKLMQQGRSLRLAAKAAPVRRLVSGVQNKTRGGSHPSLLKKTTVGGLKRRAELAEAIRAKRAGRAPMTLANQHKQAGIQRALQQSSRRLSSLASTPTKKTKRPAQRPPSNPRVVSVRNSTRLVPHLKKGTTAGRLNRHLLAQDLRQARKGPHTSPMFNYRTLDLRR